jgi:hypothetical protein
MSSFIFGLHIFSLSRDLSPGCEPGLAREGNYEAIAASACFCFYCRTIRAWALRGVHLQIGGQVKWYPPPQRAQEVKSSGKRVSNCSVVKLSA